MLVVSQCLKLPWRAAQDLRPPQAPKPTLKPVHKAARRVHPEQVSELPHATASYSSAPQPTGGYIPGFLLYCVPGVQCIPQRAALLKSMLNFLKKAIQDPAFSDGIRHGKWIFDQGPFPVFRLINKTNNCHFEAA